MKRVPLRRRIANVLEGEYENDLLARGVDLFLHTLILLNVVAITLESVATLQSHYRDWFWRFEIFSVATFSVEYLLRLWCSVDFTNARTGNSLHVRLRYLLTPMALVDLVAILPFFLGLFLTLDLRFLRVVRLLRVLKLTRYSPALHVLGRVFKREAHVLGSAFFLLFIMLILTASIIHLLEQEAQPEVFGSIPESMWWAVVTLTTVGYGDVTPLTPLGKLFGGIITILGVGMVALPTAIIASGFAEEMRRGREEYEEVVSHALRDGHLSHEEQLSLEELRRELDLDEEEANRLMEKIARSQLQLSNRHHNHHCPHCGKRL